MNELPLKKETRARVLYISYTGMLEPLGQSQVLQYLFKLKKSADITLISFEKTTHFHDQDKIAKLRDSIKENGVDWIPLRYHKNPPVISSLYDIAHMLFKTARLHRKHSFNLIHCRSYMAGITGLLLKKLFGIKLLFDMRGFWPDERVDSGVWKKTSMIYLVVKRIEKSLLLNADHIVSLTHSGVREIHKFPYIDKDFFRSTVIPTCTNLDFFRRVETSSAIPEQNQESKMPEPFVVGMVGSVGGWYLFDKMIECFRKILEINPSAKLMILNKSDHQFIQMELNKQGVAESCVEVLSADYIEVSKYMSQMDIGLFFIKPVFSKQASAPTKLGEFLGCGVPCISNAGIGDMDMILEPTNTGVCIREFDDGNYTHAYERIENILSGEDSVTRCRETAERYFSLERGAEDYDRIYQELLS